MSEALGALLLLVRVLPERRCVALGDGLALIVAANGVDRDRALRIAMNCAGRALSVSRSRAGDRYAAVVAEGGQVGMDMETIGRVALNTTPHDPWLAPVEQDLVRRSADAVTELACLWVLKEAYGKACGVGLALPLRHLGFGVASGTVVLRGDATCDPGWRFGLFRRADALFGVAFRPDR